MVYLDILTVLQFSLRYRFPSLKILRESMEKNGSAIVDGILWTTEKLSE
jgi:hypothetical protein